MIGLSVNVSQGADLFVNVMHFVDRSLVQRNPDYETPKVTFDILNNMYYSGIQSYYSASRYYIVLFSE